MESIHLHLRVLDKAPVSRHRLPLFCLLSKAGSQTGLFPVNATLLCLVLCSLNVTQIQWKILSVYSAKKQQMEMPMKALNKVSTYL